MYYTLEILSLGFWIFHNIPYFAWISKFVSICILFMYINIQMTEMHTGSIEITFYKKYYFEHILNIMWSVTLLIYSSERGILLWWMFWYVLNCPSINCINDDGCLRKQNKKDFCPCIPQHQLLKKWNEIMIMYFLKVF